MSEIAYYRVSTNGQTIAAQRSALSGSLSPAFEQEFIDEGVSGSVLAEQRPAFAAMLRSVRKGDRLHVSAIDRLGRDAPDIQRMVRKLMDMGVALDVRGLGGIAPGIGEVIVAVLAQIAQMEREAIAERTAAGRATAQASLAATGRTHRGKMSLGRPPKCDAAEVRAWREANGASLSETAKHFSVSVGTVKCYSASEVATTGGAHGRDPGKRGGARGGMISLPAYPTVVVDGEAAASTDAGRTIGIGLAGMPVPVGSKENVGERVVPSPALDNVEEPFIGEVDVPLPLGLAERAPVNCFQGNENLDEQPVALVGGNIEPRRLVTPKHRGAHGGGVRESRGGPAPMGSMGGVDCEPMLPFDDPQGGLGEKRGG